MRSRSRVCFDMTALANGGIAGGCSRLGPRARARAGMHRRHHDRS